RIITGPPQAAKNDTVLLEAGMAPLAVMAQLRQLRLFERYQRLPETDQRRLNLDMKAMRQAEQQARDLRKEAGVGGNRLPLSAPRDYAPHQTDFARRVMFGARLKGPKSSLTKAQQCRVSKRVLDNHLVIQNAAWQSWSDGSVTPDERSAGAACLYRYRKDEPWFRKGALAGKLASSLRAEAVGVICSLEMVINTLRARKRRGSKRKGVAILLDSRSLLDQLRGGPLQKGMERDVQVIWNLLHQLTGLTTYVVFQHVYSHCGLEKNELVDEYAAAVAQGGYIPVLSKTEQAKLQAEVPTKLSDFMCFAKRRLVQRWAQTISPEECRVKLVGTKPTNLRATKKWPRYLERTAAQIRSGECPLVGKNRHRWGDTKGGVEVYLN
ncbi:MAG: hypothetical protein D6722_12275, partial [Bacteroidetes bacterium]